MSLADRDPPHMASKPCRFVDQRFVLLALILAEFGGLSLMFGWPWTWTRAEANERQQACANTMYCCCVSVEF